MKYWPPYDNQSDPDAPYINGNPAIGQQGSIPPAQSIEHPMREVVNMIANSNLVPDQNDLEQMTQAVRSGYVNYVVDTGSTNALSVAFDPPLLAYTAGLPVNVKVGNTNSGAATISVNALGARSIVNADGSQLTAGSLVQGQVASLLFDGANFQLVNSASAAGAAEFRIPFAQDVGTVNALIANFTPPITELYPGLMIEVKAATTNTGPSTLNVNGTGVKSIIDPDGTAIEAGDISLGQVLLLIYDGVKWQLSSFITGAVAAGIPYVADTGTQNALVGNYVPAISSYVAGLTVEVKAAFRNTGAATFNANGLGIKAIVSPDGQPLVDGAFEVNAVLLLIYDGAAFQLVNFQTGRGTRYVTDTGTANALVVAPTPPVLVYRDGLQLFVRKKASTPNTGPMTIAVSGLAAQSIFTPYGDPHGAHGWAGNEVGHLIYGGGSFKLMPPRHRKRNVCVLSRTDQNYLPSGAWSEINLNIEHDPNGWKGTTGSRIVAPCAGLYDIRAIIWATAPFTGVVMGRVFDVAQPANQYGFDAKEMLGSNPGGLFINIIRSVPAATYSLEWYSSNGSFRWNYVFFSLERLD